MGPGREGCQCDRAKVLRIERSRSVFANDSCGERFASDKAGSIFQEYVSEHALMHATTQRARLFEGPSLSVDRAECSRTRQVYLLGLANASHRPNQLIGQKHLRKPS